MGWAGEGVGNVAETIQWVVILLHLTLQHGATPPMLFPEFAIVFVLKLNVFIHGTGS